MIESFRNVANAEEAFVFGLELQNKIRSFRKEEFASLSFNEY